MSRGAASCILSIGRIVRMKFKPWYISKKEPCYPLDLRLVRHQILSEGGCEGRDELYLPLSGIESLSPISYVEPRVRMWRALPSLPLTSTWPAAELSTGNTSHHCTARISQQSCVWGKRNLLPAFCNILCSCWLTETRLYVAACFP